MKSLTVQCPQCKTRYKITIDPSGKKRVRLRCSRCGTVFSCDTAANANRATPPLPQEAATFPREDDFQKIAELIHDINRPDMHAPSRGNGVSLGNNEVHQGSFDDSAEGGIRRKSAKRIVLPILLLVMAIAGGLVCWKNTGLQTSLLNTLTPAVSRIETLVGLHNKKDRTTQPEENIAFTNVHESFQLNWMDGHVLVIEGNTVNKNPFPISRIKVRGKLLDNSKQVIDQKESYCGNILSEEELRNLTEEEIDRKLLSPARYGTPLGTVPPGGTIPFMLVFASSSKKAGEFIVEPSEIVPRQRP